MNNKIISGALFDFMGWLTSRPKRIMLSSTDNASPAVDAIKDFAKMRGLSLNDARVQDWQEALAEQPAPVWLDQHEFPLRGILASELKCWHRLTEEEADNLVAFVKRAAPQPSQQQNGIEFLMNGDKMAFKIGVQQFTLDYEPIEPGEFEFMCRMLTYAFSTFTPDVKPAQQQEPEWYHFVRHGEDCFVPYKGQAPEKATPLYTSPPTLSLAQRQARSADTWVGLTDEEIEAEFGFIDELLRDCCYRTEAKLKEKNGL